MSPWAVKRTAAGAVVDAGPVAEEGPAGEEDSRGLAGVVAGGPDVPGETGVPGGGAGGPDWQAVSSSASESAAGAMPDHVRCFDSPVMIPHVTELSLIPLRAGSSSYCQALRVMPAAPPCHTSVRATRQ